MSQQRRRPRGLWLLYALAGAAAAAALGAYASARLADSGGVIHACVPKSGVLRVVDPDKPKCKRGEQRLAFNQRGRQGPRGPRGLPGSPGLPGAPGAPGANGRDAGTIVDGGGCTAIQAAIDGLPAGGGTVLVRPGTYTCQTYLHIDRDKVALRGSGPATVLKLADEARRPVIVIGQDGPTLTETRRHVTVSDLFIDGNEAHQTFECHESGIDGPPPQPCQGDDVLRNDGITLRRAQDAVVERVIVENARSGGVVASRDSSRVTIRGVTVSNSHFDGVSANETTKSLFSGLHLSANGRAGLSFDGNFDNNVLSDILIEDSATVGVFMRTSRDNLFMDLQVRGSAEHGLFLAQVDQDASTPAAGNTFVGIVVTDSQDSGMRVNNDSCVDNVVVGAQFIDNGGGGISESTPGLVTQFATKVRP